MNRRNWLRFTGSAILATLIGIEAPLLGDRVDIGYSFVSDAGQSGGVAEVTIDTRDGRILSNQVLFASDRCSAPEKVRSTSDGRIWAVTNLGTEQAELFVFDRRQPKSPAGISLKKEPDELRVVGPLGLLTGQDTIAVVDLEKKQVKGQWDVRDIMSPAANSPEDIFITADEQYAVVSFQKDSKKGKNIGNRLAIFHFPSMQPVADLPLPRDRPELHIPADRTEAGPGPEVIYVSPSTDTLVVTLDLYGAVGMASWSAALEGRLDDWTTVTTSLGADSGLSFPDRASPVMLGESECYLVCNAGVAGGSVLVQLKPRRVVWRRETPPGLEAPVFFPELKKAFTVCSGKTKLRTPAGVTKESHPGKELFVFDFSSAEAARNAPVNSVSLNAFTVAIASISQSPPLLLLATGDSSDRIDSLVTVDASTLQILDRHPASGLVRRFGQ